MNKLYVVRVELPNGYLMYCKNTFHSDEASEYINALIENGFHVEQVENNSTHTIWRAV